ncbi:MAG: hypothetical protein GEV28_15405 [Actinophytocola sp.]|uniref:DUF6541 family protein n=1 Tax=Actinophytocola sp. TaxID=1872138 RepID=UPI0013298815|nr:DUF6541 family protein [Actinophytocola sp.]MPZ81706.1 hypothetical protein [Actinophytocola sp.]
MSWWQLTPALACTAAIVFLPGYLVLRSWAVTGLVAVGMAAPFSVSLIAITAVLGPLVGLRWNVLVVVVPALALAAVGLVLRKLTPTTLAVRDHAARPVRSRWPLLVHLGALLIPALLLTRGLTRMIGAPENISQTYDNVFHLNAIRYILESGSGSSLTMGGMYSNGASPASYPAAWHDLVSLVVQVAGVSIPAAVNAVTLVVGALVWPISCIFLTTRVTGTRPVPLLFAGALSSVFGAFPYLMVDFGVLYPFFLSLALLPAGIALIAMATGVGIRGGTPRWLAALGLAIAAAGIALAHPSTLMALLVFAVPILVVALVRYRRILAVGRAAALRYWSVVVLMLGYLLFGVVLWDRLRPGDKTWWPPIETMPQAIGKILSAGFSAQGPTWVVLLLTLVAAGLVMRRQLSWWVLGTYLIAASLYVIVAAMPSGPLRNFVTGVWYNDSFRLAGQLPVITVVLSAIAAVWLFTRTVDLLAARRPAFERLRSTPTAGPAAAVAAFVVAAVIGVVGQYSSVNYAVGRGQASYTPTEESPVLSPDERDLLDRLDEEIPEGDSVIGNPWTGTALAYAVAGRRMLTPHVGGTIPPEILDVMDNLDEIGTDPEVCATIRELRSYYVLDFDGPQVHNRDIHFDGLDSLGTNPGLTEIDHEGSGARLFRITAC